MKKFRRSPFTIACYVFAAMFAAYFVTVVISTVSTITQYYAAYDMSPTFGEVATYLFQQGTMPLFAAIGTFMAGIILDEVRKATRLTGHPMRRSQRQKKQRDSLRRQSRSQRARLLRLRQLLLLLLRRSFLMSRSSLSSLLLLLRKARTL